MCKFNIHFYATNNYKYLSLISKKSLNYKNVSNDYFKRRDLTKLSVAYIYSVNTVNMFLFFTYCDKAFLKGK